MRGWPPAESPTASPPAPSTPPKPRPITADLAAEPAPPRPLPNPPPEAESRRRGSVADPGASRSGRARPGRGHCLHRRRNGRRHADRPARRSGSRPEPLRSPTSAWTRSVLRAAVPGSSAGSPGGPPRALGALHPKSSPAEILREQFLHQFGEGFLEPAAGRYLIDFGGWCAGAHRWHGGSAACPASRLVPVTRTAPGGRDETTRSTDSVGCKRATAARWVGAETVRPTPAAWPRHGGPGRVHGLDRRRAHPPVPDGGARLRPLRLGDQTETVELGFRPPGRLTRLVPPPRLPPPTPR